MASGYDIGVATTVAPQSGASNASAFEVNGGGKSSQTTTLLIVVVIVVGFVVWLLNRKK